MKLAKTKVENAKKILDQAKVMKLKKENVKIVVHKNLQKQLHKELKAYLKARPALAKLLK